MTIEKQGYQPSDEEVNKGGEMLTPEQKRDLAVTEQFYLPASWVDKCRGKEYAEIEALRQAAYSKCCGVLWERYEEYGDTEGSFWLSGEIGLSDNQFIQQYGHKGYDGRKEALEEAEEILKDWKPTEEELKFFVGHSYWGPRIDLKDIDIEQGKDFFHDFAAEEKYIGKIREFIEERDKINSRQYSPEQETRESSAHVRGQIEDLKWNLVGPAVARMIGMNTIWREGIKEVNQNDNEQTFRAITTLLAFMGELGKFEKEVELLRKNILKVYPEVKI